MNLTIPIRAHSSTSSLSRGMRDSSVKRAIRSNRQRNVFLVVTAVFVSGSLVFGSAGSIMSISSAHSNYWWLQNSSGQTAHTLAEQTQPITVNTVPPVPALPAPTPTPVPATVSAPIPTPVPTPAATPVAVETAKPAPVKPSAPRVAPTSAVTPRPAVIQRSVVTATPVPVDTGREVAATVTAQATNSSQPVTYTNDRMSPVTRDRLIMLAIVAGTTGVLLYVMSSIGMSARSKLKPVQYNNSI